MPPWPLHPGARGTQQVEQQTDFKMQPLVATTTTAAINR